MEASGSSSIEEWADQADGRHATIYEDENYAGRSQQLAVWTWGPSDWPQMRSIRSIGLTPNTTATLRTAGGWETTYTASAPRLGNNANPASIKVAIVDPVIDLDARQPPASGSHRLQDFTAELSRALQGVHLPDVRGPQSADAKALTVALLGAVAASSPPAGDTSAASASKAMTMPLTLSNPALLGSEKFMGDVLSTVQSLAPIVMHVVSSAGSATGNGATIDDLVARVPAERRDDKGWIDFVTGTIGALGAPLLQAISGQKAFSDSDAPALAVPAEHIDDKAWIEDALSFVTGAIPCVLPALLGAI